MLAPLINESPHHRGERCRLAAVRRQHFLKRDTVFFNMLVYSKDVHFDSRVHAATKPSHLHLEGNMAKKAKKAKAKTKKVKKTKSAVKKTAKKTRKVAKKKK